VVTTNFVARSSGNQTLSYSSPVSVESNAAARMRVINDQSASIAAATSSAAIGELEKQAPGVIGPIGHWHADRISPPLGA